MNAPLTPWNDPRSYAYRVVSDDDRAMSALIGLGFEGPTGGSPVRNGPNSFFAYEFAA